MTATETPAEDQAPEVAHEAPVAEPVVQTVVVHIGDDAPVSSLPVREQMKRMWPAQFEDTDGNS